MTKSRNARLAVREARRADDSNEHAADREPIIDVGETRHFLSIFVLAVSTRSERVARSCVWQRQRRAQRGALGGERRLVRSPQYSGEMRPRARLFRWAKVWPTSASRCHPRYDLCPRLAFWQSGGFQVVCTCSRSCARSVEKLCRQARCCVQPVSRRLPRRCSCGARCKSRVCKMGATAHRCVVATVVQKKMSNTALHTAVTSERCSAIEENQKVLDELMHMFIDISLENDKEYQLSLKKKNSLGNEMRKKKENFNTKKARRDIAEPGHYGRATSPCSRRSHCYKPYGNSFKNKKVRVPIKVTFDDYEPNNVIGSHAGDQKLCSGKAQERIYELTPGRQPPPSARPTRDRRPNRSSTAAAQRQHNSSTASAKQQPCSHYQHQHQEVNCRRSL
ncbi:unnamed protein product [Trichogramma brassicae]|uniref:Uncharacterized protein n=1 Tax=Trichogramma brassicae TaxID=86971 RepID=A0A6H5ITP0_9HYME|nr:unnamed protein product [Trichogramma brassicae]